MNRFRSAMILVCYCVLSLSGIAQNSAVKYNAEAENIRKEVWGWDNPEFKQRTVPAEYAGFSKVFIARHLDVNADSKKKLALRVGLTSYRELMLNETLREVIKLNDKAAVSEYSEFRYTQLEKKSGFYTDHTTTVYMGIRVIKADGSVKEINTDDIILTRDLKKQKEAKIAVPDLQVGDIIDYFVVKHTNMSQIDKIPSYLFLFYDDVPIMHCSMHFEIGKKYAVEYRSYNGAPDFKTTMGDDRDNILDIVKKNIPAVAESNLWTSAFRQLPIVRVNIIVGNKGLMASRLNARRPGELYKNQVSDEYLEDRLRMIANTRTTTRLIFTLGKTSGSYMRTVKKNFSNMSTDSAVREMFYIFRFHNFLEQIDAGRVSSLVEMPKIDLDENLVTYYLGEFFKSEDIDNNMIYTTLNRGPRIKEILSTEDLNNIIKVRGVDAPYYGFSHIFTCPSYLPSYLENSRNAISVNTGGIRETNYNRFQQTTVDIPGSLAAQNSRTEKLNVALSPGDMALEIKRQSTLKGHYKAEEQKRLILFEDYYNSEIKYFNEDKTLIEKLSDGRKTKKLAEELQEAFSEARKKNKESFIEEAKDLFDQEIKDIKNYKVENSGVRHTAPDLVYSSEFKMNNMVKKAGTSYIIDIGKLQGGQLKISGEQRKRSLDIYAPFSRSLNYEISFTIPDGYVAEGFEALNKKVENSAGSFISEVKATDKVLTVSLKKIYMHSYEPAANWNNMLAFIDAANEWSNSKIVLKKKG